MTNESSPDGPDGQAPHLGDERLADVLESVSDGFYALDPDWRYVVFNRAAEEYFAIPRENVLGKVLWDVFPQGRGTDFERYCHMAMNDGAVTRFETASKLRPERVVELRVGPLRGGGVAVTLRDVTERLLTEARLRESEEDYRQAAELNPQVAWTATPDGEMDRVAARWLEWTGTSGLGTGYVLGLHPDDAEPTRKAWGRSVNTGEPYDIVHRVRRTNGEFRWIRSRAYPRRDADGNIVRWYGATEDIHEQKLAEEHLRLMVLELNHRVKNNLATVQAIAVQTLRGAHSVPEAREAFLSRIMALAAAHDILTREQWEGVGVREVARGVLDALDGGLGGRVTLRGQDIRLTSKAALALSMAFHELGANALKYGALKVPEGEVGLDWTVVADPERRLRLHWVERGGPPVETPSFRGFGSRLLERGLAAELQGKVSLEFRPDGVRCEIETPVTIEDGVAVAG
ncbi:MAG: PAS domain-containing protein [Phenylobacterium sp.]